MSANVAWNEDVIKWSIKIQEFMILFEKYYVFQVERNIIISGREEYNYGI